MTLWLFVLISLTINSQGAPSTDQNQIPSQIVINDNFRDSILSSTLSSKPNPFVSNIVHQGTNFFFNPNVLLGTFVPSQFRAFAPTGKENITETPTITKEPILPENIKSKEITPTHSPSIVIDESIHVRPPFTTPTLINESKILTPPSSPPRIPKIPENIMVKQIPPAPILPPLELPKITKIIDETVEIFPACTETKIVVPPTLLPIHMVERGLNFIKKDFIHVSPKHSTIKIVQIPAILELPTSVTHEISKFLDKGETVILVPPVPRFPNLINPSSSIEPVFLDDTADLLIPTVCARDIIVERVLPNIVISKKMFTKYKNYK